MFKKESLMKKQAVILALFLLIASHTLGSVSAATAPILGGSAERKNGGVSVTCWYETIADAANVRDILCAVYDKVGALLALDALDPDKGMQTALISCDAAQADCVKLFAVDWARRPIGPACVRALETASVALAEANLGAGFYPEGIDNIDMAFSLSPSFTAQSDAVSWDMLIWSDVSCQYEMYVRSRRSDSAAYDVSAATDANGWRRVQNPTMFSGVGNISISSANENQRVGESLHFNLYGYGAGEIPRLSALSDERAYEYAIRFLELDGDNERANWNREANFYISVIAGTSNQLGTLASNVTEERFQSAKREGAIQELSAPGNLGFRLTKVFSSRVAPTFASGAPTLTSSKTSVEMFLRLSGPGTAFYVIAPADAVPTRDLAGRVIDWTVKDEIPTAGSDVLLDSQGNEVRDENGNLIPLAPFYVSVPSYLAVINPQYANANVKTGYASDGVTVVAGDLLPGTDYFAYFVLHGAGQSYSQYAQIYRFTTLAAAETESASVNALHMDLLDGRVGDTCSGRVSLTFNEYLYCLDDSASPPTLCPLDRGPISSPLRELPENRNFRSVASLAQSRSSEQISLVEDDESQVGKRTVTIELQLDHAENGTFLTFSPNLCDQYSNVRNSPLTVSVRIVKLTTQVDVDDKGEPVYGYVSTPLIEITPEWDGATYETRQ